MIRFSYDEWAAWMATEGGTGIMNALTLEQKHKLFDLMNAFADERQAQDAHLERATTARRQRLREAARAAQIEAQALELFMEVCRRHQMGATS